MRVFLAIDIDSGVREKLKDLESELRPLTRRARWVRPDGLHLTLRFFGEVPPREVEALAAGLAEAFVGIPAFTLDFHGCGVFPDRRNPRVFWVGVRNAPKALFELQSRAEVVARAMGFSHERRPFEPHLTVARFRGPERELDSILSGCGARDFGPSEVAEAILFESHLSPAGASYEKVRTYHLHA